MAHVQFKAASRIFPGSAVPAVHKLDLDVVDGELLVLVGPTGAGKSTALRMLAGLEDVNEGAIFIGGRDVSHVPPKERDVALVFQNYALYPHMSVAENMGFALKLAGVSEEERNRKVAEAAALLDLTDYLDRTPKALSGGQRQRVAMGRAIVRDPAVFLMDEPLSNLDAKLRVETRAQIVALQARLGTTTIYVTHDPVEAMAMGHRVAVLKQGGFLQQVDTPGHLYDRPVNAFVAAFIGTPAMNLVRAPLGPGGATIGGLVVGLSPDVLAAAERAALTEILLGVRPESLQLSEPDADGLTVRVNVVDEIDGDTFVFGDLPGHELDRQFVARIDARNPPRAGDTVDLTVRPGAYHAFDPRTGERLGD